MKYGFIFFFLIVVLIGKAQQHPTYKIIDGRIPEEVLKNYLSRSITQAEFLASDGFNNYGVYPYKEDDI